ncbi:hypothetical protein WJX79_009043 [Trebouxia sp. C0005]|nr:MAG: 3-hydroxyisobutyryl- hydrolase [Trebouxia sp. A1-2]
MQTLLRPGYRHGKQLLHLQCNLYHALRLTGLPSLDSSFTVSHRHSTAANEEHLLVRKEAGLGRITINRPKALNAKNCEMVEAAHQALADFVKNKEAAAVLIDSSGDKAFCAGGDIRDIRQAVLDSCYDKDPPLDHRAARVFQAEYSLMCDIVNCPIPYISLCNGIWMGFGVGFAVHGDIRVVTENTMFAMPENMIGLWPDVGFARVAATKAPGATGLYLALTGSRLKTPEDLLYAGLGTHFVPSGQVPALREALAKPLKRQPHKQHGMQQILDRLQPYAQEVDTSSAQLAHDQPAIDYCFKPALGYKATGQSAGQAVLKILSMLREVADNAQAEKDKDFAKNAMKSMSAACPTSLCLSLYHFAQVHADTRSQGPLSNIYDLMKQEYCGATRMVSRHDFIEGVRAMMVDKDKSPKWDPKDLSQVSDEDLESILDAMPKELELGWKEQLLI